MGGGGCSDLSCPSQNGNTQGESLCLPRPGSSQDMSWVLPLRHFHGGQKCIPPLTYLEMLKNRGCIFPLSLGLLGTRVLTSCSDWGSLGSSCVSFFILKLFWDRTVSFLSLELSGWSFIAPAAAPLCLGQEFSARQVIEFLCKSNVES